MINPFAEIDWKPSESKRRQFGKVLALVFTAIAAVLALFTSTSSAVLVGLYIGAAAGFICWVFPGVALPLYVAWHALGAAIGLVVSNALLAITYYAVVTPIALVLRLIGRDPLQRRFEPHSASYWEPVKRTVDPASYFRQF